MHNVNIYDQLLCNSHATVCLSVGGYNHRQSLQEAFYQAQQSRQEARDRKKSRRKPNMTDSLCRKRKLADSFVPGDY